MGNKIIILDEIVKDLSEMTNTSTVLSESFIKSLFTEIAGQLTEQGVAEIPGLGKFYVEKGNVRFEVDKELESGLNVAFESFEPVELDDDFNFEEEDIQSEDLTNAQLKVEDGVGSNEGELGPVVPSESEVEPEPVAIEPEKEPVLQDEVPNMESKQDLDEDSNMTAAENDGPIDDNNSDGDSVADSVDFEEEHEKGEFFDRRFWIGILTGTSVCIIAFACWMYFDNADEPIVESVQHSTEMVAVDDTIRVAEETNALEVSAKQEQTDTIEYKDQYFKVTTAAYLSNVSRKYYDHYAFWIYIYLENKEAIKDPDNIPIGLTLRIPDPRRYGIDKNDPKSVKRAQIKALEYSKEN